MINLVLKKVRLDYINVFTKDKFDAYSVKVLLHPEATKQVEDACNKEIQEAIKQKAIDGTKIRDFIRKDKDEKSYITPSSKYDVKVICRDAKTDAKEENIWNGVYASVVITIKVSQKKDKNDCDGVDLFLTAIHSYEKGEKISHAIDISSFFSADDIDDEDEDCPFEPIEDDMDDLPEI